MLKSTFLGLFFLLFCTATNAQTAEELINSGVYKHDLGKYEEAIEFYEKALKIDPKSDLANYEMANTYFMMGEYKKSITFADKVIKFKKDNIEGAYIIKGNALDQLKKPADAIKIYKEGIKKCPNSYLLNYNLGLTYYTNKKISESELALQEAIKCNPQHGSSNFLLGVVMYEQNNRAKSMLAFYKFLLIEPTGKRATLAYDLLEKQWNKGISKDSPNKINISISSIDSKDEFSSAELFIGLIAATRDSDENKDLTDQGYFNMKTEKFLKMIGETGDKKKGFWVDYFSSYLQKIVTSEYSESFGYYISQVSKSEEVTKYLESNTEKMEQFNSFIAKLNMIH